MCTVPDTLSNVLWWLLNDDWDVVQGIGSRFWTAHGCWLFPCMHAVPMAPGKAVFVLLLQLESWLQMCRIQLSGFGITCIVRISVACLCYATGSMQGAVSYQRLSHLRCRESRRHGRKPSAAAFRFDRISIELG